MTLDVTGIVTAKIASLEESGIIVKQIETSIEKTILDAIKSALEDYKFKREIESQVSQCVSNVASQIGFSAYNGFIAEKVRQITEGVMRDDLAQKIQKTFDDLLIIKHEGIKLSRIFNQYREWLFETTDAEEKWKRHEFTCELEVREDGNFKHIDVTLSEEPNQQRYRADIALSFCIYGDKTESEISSVYFATHKLGDNLRLGVLNPIEALIANLYYNKTAVILDLNDVDDYNHYDIDD